jgi:uncharacterized protein (DUF1778 family)
MPAPARRPATSASPARRSSRLAVRTTAEQAQIIRAAAEAQGVSIADFVVDNAMAAAHQVLADRVHFKLPPEEFDRFLAILDRPARVNPKLRELLSRPSVLEE